MICQFCKQYLDDLNSIPVKKEEFSIYTVYCPDCHAHYKLDNKDNILIIVLEYKSHRVLFISNDQNSNKIETILQIHGSRFINLPDYTINLPIQEIYNKINNLVPFL